MTSRYLRGKLIISVDAFEWITKCNCGWGKRVFNKLDAVLAECELHDLESNAPTPQPDLRAALVEAKDSLEAVLDSIGALSNPSELAGWGLTDRPLKTLASIDAVLAGKEQS